MTFRANALAYKAWALRTVDDNLPRSDGGAVITAYMTKHHVRFLSREFVLCVVNVTDRDHLYQSLNYKFSPNGAVPRCPDVKPFLLFCPIRIAPTIGCRALRLSNYRGLCHV